MNQLTLSPATQPSGFGGYVEMDGECWYKISECADMSEFFMCPVSSGDHWMFVSSRGAISAGRKNPDSALFPYYSSDKLVDSVECTGPHTVIRAQTADGASVNWQPFLGRPDSGHLISRHLYKNFLGNRLLFEEVNHSLQLAFRYGWSFSDRFGFVRTARLSSRGASTARVTVLDGIQNVLPYGIEQNFQLRFSNLGDAYKKSELVEKSKVGLFYLSSIPTDRAEPSEGLRATTVWHQGLSNPKVLLSGEQLERFRDGLPVFEEHDIRGKRGAYFVVFEHAFDADVNVATSGKDLDSNGQSEESSCVSWDIVADVNQDHADVIRLSRDVIDAADLRAAVNADVAKNEHRLLSIVSSADGRQQGANQLRVQRHQANVLFNVMRGGLPRQGYEIAVAALGRHLEHFNRQAFARHRSLLQRLEPTIDLMSLIDEVARTGDPDFCRLVLEYLPFTFSRRHGDPTRPWNAFKIDFLSRDGSEKLGYEGNWRDIFQNWEALSLSFPGYVCSMVFRFVNASTADGYNPYRITMEGFDWETVDPNDPWGNIGYWGDHQIIYLLKLLECSKRFDPQQLDRWLGEEVCAYAQVPYRIRDYAAIRKDPQETIDFDDQLAEAIDRRVNEVGDDGKLLLDASGNVCHVTLAEKLLVPALVKLSNFVPEGGVWLNTQRPEWNDANNALVGSGLSVVTACYLRRYCAFMLEWFSGGAMPKSVRVSREVACLLRNVSQTLDDFRDCFSGDIDDASRAQIVDALSSAGSEHRRGFYDNGLSGEKEELPLGECITLFERCLAMIDHTLKTNRRSDGLYHSYNLVKFTETSCSVDHLYEMLEGQVAILSSGLLSPAEAVEVLDSLRASDIYREDQQSYMLYPDRQLPRFLQKNTLPEAAEEQSPLLKELLESGETSVVCRDVDGGVHFNGDFRNAADLRAALDQLSTDPRFSGLIDSQRDEVAELFERTFCHQQFTGRSGTFFAYEGLGSIYWHMVSKLALAAIENCQWAMQNDSDPELIGRLHDHYREIRDGIGLAKTPQQYGAFPSDPYSHTPQGAGVQQPGMTGQVKEDILTRMMELGARFEHGELRFDPRLFESAELLAEESNLDFVSLTGEHVQLPVSVGCFAYTICQTPVIYHRAAQDRLVLTYADQSQVERETLTLTPEETRCLFSRSALITQIDVHLSQQSCS